MEELFHQCIEYHPCKAIYINKTVNSTGKAVCDHLLLRSVCTVGECATLRLLLDTSSHVCQSTASVSGSGVGVSSSFWTFRKRTNEMICRLNGPIEVSKYQSQYTDFPSTTKQHSVDIFTRQPFPASREQHIHVLIFARMSTFKKACVMEYPVSSHISRPLCTLTGKGTAQRESPVV